MKKFGKGRKPCRHCGEMVTGARTKTCPHCQKDISKEPETVLINGEAVPITRRTFRLPDGFNPPGGVRIQLIGVPLNNPPIPLRPSESQEFPSPDDIMDWAMQIREKETQQGIYIMNEGLLRWARKQTNGDLKYKWTSPEMKLLRSIIMGLPDVTFKEIQIETPA